MPKIDFKLILPHVIAILIFLIVALIYCKPTLEGKVVAQHDIQAWRGMSQQSKLFQEKNGYYPLWTNSMFGGMPAYQIAFDARTKLQVGYLDKIINLGLPKPISFFFLASICFYFLCLVAGASPWVSIMGGLAYAYSTFDPIIIGAGHDTQMISIGYAPAVLAGLILLFQHKYLTGFAITSFASALLIGLNHVQIVYYVLIMAGFMSIAYIIKCYKENTTTEGIKAIGLGLAAGILGLACNAVTMLPTYEYAKDTMRGGKSELTLNKDANNKTKGGLDKDYAFKWSYGIPETFTFIVPGIYGGGGKEYTASSKFAQKLTELGLPEDNAVQYANASSYWGAQTLGTSGPVYLGAVICFLFIFALFYLHSWHKWWVSGVSIFAIFLAWGANFHIFNYFLFDYLPFYNKFRAPTMSLVIPQLCFPFLAVLAISKLVTKEIDWITVWKKLRLSSFVTAAILLILAGFYFTADFTGSRDKEVKESFRQNIIQQGAKGQNPTPQLEQQATEFSRGLMSNLRSDRKDLMGGDLLRTVILIALTVVLIGLFIRRKVKPFLLISGLIILSSFDLLGVDKRYLSEGNFVDESDFENAFNPSEADQQILKDPDHSNFRVFNTTVEWYQDASTSYFHNSIGGYHPAKLGLYNDLIENQLNKNNIRVLNMLNTKYVIIQNPANGKPVAQLNPEAYGNVWLVKGIKWVNSANEEMKALDSTNLKDTVVIEKLYASTVNALPQHDSTATIKLKENLNDKITYEFKGMYPQYAVFSEIYYNKGWDAFIDGKKTNYAKVNYVLRGMNLPPGTHEIEFKFEPSSFNTGRSITIFSNILVMILIILAFLYYLKRKKVNAHVL